MRILVTGATGFIGTALVARLLDSADTTVRCAVRSESSTLPAGAERTVVSDLAADSDWRSAVAGVDTVVHLAARVHVMRDEMPDPLAEFRRVNVAGSLNLARQAAAAGVRRLVFVSSVKVNGERGSYTEAAPPAPQDPYGVSKYEAELALRDLAAKSGLDVVVIRPPLVYGPGVKANFLTLMRAVARGVPLPLGAIHNRRSFVALDNLVDFIITCIRHPAAANETFLVSDDDDLSTTDLIRRLGLAMDRPARLIPVPATALRVMAAMLGKSDVMQRLLDTQRVDVSKARRLLGWKPPVGVDTALRRAAGDSEWFR